MNPAEKIAATYLRLNGFLLLPQFTAFGGGQHNHMDLIGLRAAASEERVGHLTLPVDDAFFAAVPVWVCADPRERLLGLVAEVKTNDERDRPTPDHIAYVQQFLGGAEILPVGFRDAELRPTWRGDYMEVGIRYVLRWIIWRFDWMNENFTGFTKTGSWPWSEDALAELLVLHRYGALSMARLGPGGAH